MFLGYEDKSPEAKFLGQVRDSGCEQPTAGTSRSFGALAEQISHHPQSRSALLLLWEPRTFIFQLHGGRNRPWNGVKISKLCSSWVICCDRVRRDKAALEEDSALLTRRDGAAGGPDTRGFSGRLRKLRLSGQDNQGPRCKAATGTSFFQIQTL